jgi:ABC-type multidrug transport system ATPase subunit
MMLMTPTNDTMMKLVNVVQHYGVRPVLRDVSLEVKRGELVGIMGPNGVGKSSLLGVMAGILPPMKGYVEIAGKRRRSSEEAELEIRRKTVYLPDHPWLPKNRTGREFLIAIGRLYDIPYERLLEHIDRLLCLFNLEEKGDSVISSYSSGQQKKIAICGFLVTEAPVMVLDEPFSGGLDPSAILALRHIFLRLAKRDDVAIVLATPVPELVEGLAHRVAILMDGRIVAYDTPEGLARMTERDGSLQEVLEDVINPNTFENLELYFKELP